MGGESRFEEIDLFRGIAILMMVLFHTLFDIRFFGIAPVNVSSGFWRYFAYATATLFLFLVGVSLVVSHARAARHRTGFALVKKFLLRGARQCPSVPQLQNRTCAHCRLLNSQGISRSDGAYM